MKGPLDKVRAAAGFFLLAAGLWLPTALAAVTAPHVAVDGAAPSLSLTFEQRLADARAIERVYWSHRIWPVQNPSPKPTFDQVMPAAVLRAKVEDDLKMSNALERTWGRPITAAQLQAEIHRMVRSSRQPDVLKEVFDALGNDPVRIAESIARPLLAKRLIRNWYARDPRFHDALRRTAEAALARNGTIEGMAQLGGEYKVTKWRHDPDISDHPDRDVRPDLEDGALRSELAAATIRLGDAEWDDLLGRLHSSGGGAAGSARSTAGRGLPEFDSASRSAGRSVRPAILVKTLGLLREDDDSFSVTAVLEQGSDEVTTATVVWSKTPFESWWRDESRGLPTEIAIPDAAYSLPSARLGSCTNDTWAPTMSVQAPPVTTDHTAVWTGSEMLVWGGYSTYNYYQPNYVLRYSPSTDTWTIAGHGSGAPSGRRGHTAVWTGSSMIVWGGIGSTTFATGGRYDPSTDTWTATGTGASLPTGRTEHTAIWTGSLMIVWGGRNGATYFKTGGRYNPSTDTWTATNSASINTPSVRSGHTAVWTGSGMIVWGGTDGTTTLGTGSSYNVSGNSWTVMATSGAPAARKEHTAVWTGSQMIVWGGTDGTSALATGGRYNPTTNAWTATSETGPVPAARLEQTAVWTGSEMIIWGGEDDTSFLGTGGRYVPSTDTWTATSIAGGVPSARAEHTAVWTGGEMIVWGGEGEDEIVENTGGRYNPVSDTWVSTSTAGVQGRWYHTAVWTGSEMIVWGGYFGDSGSYSNKGQRYDPTTDSWALTSISVATPSPRVVLSSVWTGSEMIVWGGYGGGPVLPISGGRYSPMTDTWTATSTGAGVPPGRGYAPAVWTGSEMIVWGGLDGVNVPTNTGGRYNPSTDSWQATNAGPTAPSPRLSRAVWANGEMIVWGGNNQTSAFNTGGRYDPSTDSWTPTSTGTNVPSARAGHALVWTGSEMIVWGGHSNNPIVYTSTGARYDPSTDSWTPTSTGTNTPSPRGNFPDAAIWTGNEMIVWGGGSGGPYLNTGGRYNPAGDFWIPTSTGANVPEGRGAHTLVATGSEMIVWGGTRAGATGSEATVLRTGGAYCYACTPVSWYQDTDGDGYGNAMVSLTSCGQPPGYAAASGDCDDTNSGRNPGAVESCDGIDNDCDGTVDDAMAPSAVPALLVGEPAPGTARLVWGAVAEASAYDIVRGSLVTLHTSGGDFAAATGTCLENDFAATTRDDGSPTGAGEGYWYLVRAVNCGGSGSYDSGAPSQVGSRDAEILASGNACP